MSNNHESERIEQAVTPDQGAAIGHIALGDRPQQKLEIEDVLPGLNGEAQEAFNVLGEDATLVVGANITGPWHYSHGRIDTFHKDVAAKQTGKFGYGTYLGVGELTGETVDGLTTSGALRHEVGFTGNILALNRNNVGAVAARLREVRGMPRSRLKTTAQNAPLTDFMADLEFSGHTVDAVMVYMDPEQKTAEIAVLPEAVENIKVASE